MNLFEFLTFILQAHAQSLQRLAAFFGEEELLVLLELAGDAPPGDSPQIQLNPAWFEKARFSDASYAYSQLEGAVQESHLPPMLEFHVWTYPFYREFIESSFELTDRLRGPVSVITEELVSEALIQAKNWIKTLPIPAPVRPQAEQAAWIPWLRFRTLILKKVGSSPIQGLPEWRSGRRSSD